MAALTDKSNRRARLGRLLYKIFIYLLLIVFSFAMLYPMIFMFLAGLFSAEEYYLTTLTLFPFPSKPTLENYFALFNLAKYPSFIIYFANSLGRTVYSTVMAVITVLFCSYVFARMRFAGKNVLFLALLFTTMIPGTITLIPTYLMYANWPFTGGKGILDTWWVYVITGPAINVMGTFVAKQYIETIPVSLDEQAKIDGANIIQIMFRIILPVAKPIFMYIVITTAIGVWNDWSTSFFFTSSDSLQVLPSAITQLSMEASTGMTIPNYPLMITLGLAVTIPALIIYLVFQKYIVESIAFVGIKG